MAVSAAPSIKTPIFVSMYDQLKRMPVIHGLKATVNGVVQPTAQLTDELRRSMILPVTIQNSKGQAVKFGALFEAVRTAEKSMDLWPLFMSQVVSIPRVTVFSFQIRIHGQMVPFKAFHALVNGTGGTEPEIRSTLARLEEFAAKQIED
jgi:hypothetical protein